VTGNATYAGGSNVFTGPSTFSNSLTVAGGNGAVFTGPSTFGDSLTVNGNALFSNGAAFTAGSEALFLVRSVFSNDVTVSGNVVFTGGSNVFQDVMVTGPAVFSNDVTILGSNVVVGPSTFSNDVTILGSNVTVDGVITCASLTQTSDRRLKTAREDIKDALAILSRLQPQTYAKLPHLTQESGFIAQDVWDNVPELRHLVASSDPSQFTLSLNYLGLIAYLVRAVQELDIRTRG
jgi:hypothetical protein